MDQYRITTEMLISIILNDELIENYPDDYPCPSALLLGKYDNNHYHIVIGDCTDHIRIITLYIPSNKQWINFRIRKKRKNETK